jgi:hypothetical protein
MDINPQLVIMDIFQDERRRLKKKKKKIKKLEQNTKNNVPWIDILILSP